MNWTEKYLTKPVLDIGELTPHQVLRIKIFAILEARATDQAKQLREYYRESYIDDQLQIWADEELRHAEVLGRVAKTADPSFDLDEARQRFHSFIAHEDDGSKRHFHAKPTVFLAHAIAEGATSGFYQELQDSAPGKDLRQIAHFALQEESAHENLFLRLNEYYQKTHPPLSRLRTIYSVGVQFLVFLAELMSAYVAVQFNERRTFLSLFVRHGFTFFVYILLPFGKPFVLSWTKHIHNKKLSDNTSIVLSKGLIICSIFLVMFILKNKYYINIFVKSYMSLPYNPVVPTRKADLLEDHPMRDTNKTLDVGDLVGGCGIVAFILSVVLLIVLPRDVSFAVTQLPILFAGVGGALVMIAISRRTDDGKFRE